jgi:uncharacterized repeat protein (TIGR03803 family)
MAVVSLILASRVTAQTFTTLYNFSATHPNSLGVYTNSDGSGPAGLTLSGNTFYGVTGDGGSGGSGTIFKINTNGTGFTTLYNFSAIHINSLGFYTNSDGAGPIELILSGNTLYGAAQDGGSGGSGTIFKINTNGTGFTSLHDFGALQINSLGFETNSDGALVNGLILSGNTLYGTTGAGSPNFSGTEFKVNTDGSGFAMLYSFTRTSPNGYVPSGSLCLAGDTLYETTPYGGSGSVVWEGGGYGNGTVFRINTDGAGYTNLYSFTTPSFTGLYSYYTNSDGGQPVSGVILSGNTFFGTAEQGGTECSGTVFALNTNGTGFTVLHNFSAFQINSSYYSINSDGVEPIGLIVSGNTLYGAASGGGPYGFGTVFALYTNGARFTVLHSFTATYGSNATNSDGAYGGVAILLGNTLYGEAWGGGSGGSGTIYSILLPGPPQLSLNKSGTNVVLMWPTNATGYTLQSTTNLVPPVNWNAVSSTPVVVKTNNVVTNSLSGVKIFYRLSQ